MLDTLDSQLLAAIQQGLPLEARPYLLIAEQVGCTEADVMARLASLQTSGLIKRLGVIVKHRRLGYQANAMVVWDIPDLRVNAIGKQISNSEFVNLCYQRPRQGQHWPYNLYCMIHGKSRDTVLQQLNSLISCCGLQTYKYEVLFSRQCFKQQGAVYPLI